MSGEFTDGQIEEPINKPEPGPEEKEDNDSGFDTDVDGIKADDIVKHGNTEFPCFAVSKQEFFNNMTDTRKKTRFKSGSTVQQYMQKTKYNKPFFIEYEENGKKFRRKIK